MKPIAATYPTVITARAASAHHSGDGPRPAARLPAITVKAAAMAPRKATWPRLSSRRAASESGSGVMRPASVVVSSIMGIYLS